MYIMPENKILWEQDRDMPDSTRPTREVSAGNRGRLIDFPRQPDPHLPGDGSPVGLTSFVGRRQEIAGLRGLLADGTRLLTLTGPGGSGKTRLAMAVTKDIVEYFGDGVWWVELAPLSDPDLVAQAVASVLRVNEVPGRTLTYAIAEDLRNLEILLVLDNCEHLVGACAGFAEALLRSCPDLKILATSREALGVEGERNWPVLPLSLPELELQPAFESLMDYEAIRLFVERAKAVAPVFELTERNAAAVTRLCQRLDGIPLAIELAAAWVRMFSAEQIAQRLDDSFGLLKTQSRTAVPRQRTLRATISWSYELLDAKEEILFRRLSVFAGGFAMDAAEAVCSGEGLASVEVLDLLSHLIDKSLVLVAAQSGEARYRLLETVRFYGKEKLEESGEAEPLRERHAKYCLGLAEQVEPELRDQEAWLGRLEREHANLRMALEWSSEGGDAELGLRLAVALERFWWARGHLSEGRRWLDRGLAGSGASPAFARAQALNEAGWLALFQDDLHRAVEVLEESLALFKELENEPGTATSLANLGHTVLHMDDRERLQALSKEARALRKRFVDRSAIGELLVFLGMAALYEGDPERAAALLEESMAYFRDPGDVQRATICLTYLWMTALEDGDHKRAATLLEEDFRRLQRLEIKPQIQVYDGLMGLAVVAALGGRSARVARLSGAAEALREAIGLSLSLWDHTPSDYEAILAAARSRLGEEAWEAAWNEGRAMPPEHAIGYALDSPLTQQEGAGPSPVYPADLSAREAEVLGLVARGLTNAQIASELFISPNTVNRHLNSVYHKIGVSSRAAATHFATEHHLA